MKYLKLYENFKDCSLNFDEDSITGISILSEIEKPLYYFVAKRKIAKKIYISPEEYLKRIANNFKLSYNDSINSSSVDYEKVDKYMNDMNSGDKFPIIWYERDNSSQEGRHRALAAMKLGCDKIPVIEFSDVSYDEFIFFMRDKQDYTYDEMYNYFKSLGYKGITKLGYMDFKRYIKYNLNESVLYKEPIIYNANNEYGDIYGVIHFENTNIKHWFWKKKLSSNDYKEYSKPPVAFLNNINIYNELERGKGKGFDLYDKFEDWCVQNGANEIILESDSDEEQMGGFNLDSWYIRLGFKVIGNSGGNKIMYKELENW